MFADNGSEFCAEEFDGVEEFVVGEGGHGHLEVETGDAAEDFVDVENFFGNGFGVADESSAFGSAGVVELGASDGRPAAFLANFAEGMFVAREEIIGGLLGGVRNEADGMNADG
jgi:hypothetical protein